MTPPAAGSPRLGLANNWRQFSLLVLVNGFVGAMVGLERSILPALAEQEFHLAARAAILSFIVVFGVIKALTNYFAGRLSDRLGRKPILVAGWIIAAPVPMLLMWAPSWTWVLLANVLLGASQGLTWSATVIMKIDLAGPERRGLAMGLNEFAGYLAVAVAALSTGYVAGRYGFGPGPSLSASASWSPGFSSRLLSCARRMPTRSMRPEWAAPRVEDSRKRKYSRDFAARPRPVGRLSAGLVNNLNDGMAWGLFPLLFAASGLGLGEVGALAAIYPACGASVSL